MHLKRKVASKSYCKLWIKRECSGNCLVVNVSTLQQNINDELVNVSIWFKVNKLSINFNKTEFMVVTTKQKKPELKVSIDNNPIKQSHHIKYLGVLIDDNLNWKQQIKEQCSKVARASWALNQLKHFVDEQTLRSVYHCLIYSHLQYCIIVGGLLQNQH